MKNWPSCGSGWIISAPNATRAYRKWTPERKQTLRQAYPKGGVHLAEKELRKLGYEGNRRAIAAQAQRMGVKASPNSRSYRTANRIVRGLRAYQGMELTREEVADGMGMSPDGARYALKKLEREGKVRCRVNLTSSKGQRLWSLREDTNECSSS